VRTAPSACRACLAVAVITAACGPRAPATLAAPDTVVSIGIAQPAHGVAPDTGVAGVVRLLTGASLVTTAPTGEALPALASSWERAPDGLSWRFRLRPGLAFHDGTPLTSAGIQALLAPDDTSFQPTAAVLPGLRDIVAVDAPGPLDVVVRLSRPSTLLLEAVGMVGVRAPGEAAPGAGPFRVASREPAHTELRAFPSFFLGRPAVERVDLRSYPTQRAAWGAMMRGEIDVLYEVAPEAVQFVGGEGSAARAYSFERPYVYFLGLNLDAAPLRDAAVRRALNQAINRDEVVARALAGHGVPAAGHVWPRHWAHDARVRPPAHDPAAAARALDALGLHVLPAAADHGPARLRIAVLVPAGYPVLERLALDLQRQFGDIDVDLRLQPVPLAEMGRRLAAGRFEAYLNEMAAGPGLNWPYWFWRSTPDSAGWVRSGYRAADDALERIRGAADDDALRRAVGEFQRVLVEDPPGIFLCWGEVSRAVARRFDVPALPDRDVMRTLPQWRARPAEAP
jgi:peptide/nickel transport system substrate-binding protein